MTSRLLFATLLTTLVLSSACAGLRVHTDAYVDIAYRPSAHRHVPAPPCQWVWISSYWETGWICVPTPGLCRGIPNMPPAMRRPRTAPPSVAVPRPPAGRGGRGGQGQVDDRAWLGACDSPDPCPAVIPTPPIRRGGQR